MARHIIIFVECIFSVCARCHLTWLFCPLRFGVVLWHERNVRIAQTFITVFPKLTSNYWILMQVFYAMSSLVFCAQSKWVSERDRKIFCCAMFWIFFPLRFWFWHEIWFHSFAFPFYRQFRCMALNSLWQSALHFLMENFITECKENMFNINDTYMPGKYRDCTAWLDELHKNLK